MCTGRMMEGAAFSRRRCCGGKITRVISCLTTEDADLRKAIHGWMICSTVADRHSRDGLLVVQIYRVAIFGEAVVIFGEALAARQILRRLHRVRKTGDSEAIILKKGGI